MPTRITLVSEDLFHDGAEQEAVVRDHLPIDKLIEEIKRRYNLPDGHYALTVGDSDVVLDASLTLETAGVKTGTILHFGLTRNFSHAPAQIRNRRAVLVSGDGRTFDLVRQPALIGRPNPGKQLVAGMLDVDLTPLDPKRTSSRPHAQVIERDGQYHIESLREDNPTIVNGRAILPGVSFALKSGDQLQFGMVTLEFRLIDK